MLKWQQDVVTQVLLKLVSFQKIQNEKKVYKFFTGSLRFNFFSVEGH